MLTLDIHHHILPDFFWSETNEGHAPVGGITPPPTAADTFRRLYWDTALSWRDPVLHLLRSVVGIEPVLFGSDFPYLRRDLAIGSRAHLAGTDPLSDAERAAVLGETALTFLPRLASVRNRTSSTHRFRMGDPSSRTIDHLFNSTNNQR